MKHHVAFAGFRHPHIFALWDLVRAHSNCEIVASYEHDPFTKSTLPADKHISITHEDFNLMLDKSKCSIVAIGDVYAKRGALAISALEKGCHVISDKPIAVHLEELERITTLSRENGLSVGCQLDLVENGAMRLARKLILEGNIGDVCTINISAQHPLRLKSRASWYFEMGQHGGTINDIGIHVFDLVPWLTGSPWKQTIFAREWNSKASATPHFRDCAQFYGCLESNAACFADLSYLAPDTLGYELPQYWRLLIHGTGGMLETSYGSSHVTLVKDADTQPASVPILKEPPPTCLDDFLAEIEGCPNRTGLTTNRVLSASRLALHARRISSREPDHPSLQCAQAPTSLLATDTFIRHS